MPSGGARNIKNHELLARFHENKINIPEYNRVSYPTFIRRVLKYGREKERSLKRKTVCIARVKGNIDNNGRTCNICKEYKTWENYTKRREGPYKKDCKCRSCKKQIGREYRQNGGKEVQKLYMQKIKTLAIGEVIQFGCEKNAQEDILTYGMIRKRVVVGKENINEYKIHCKETKQYERIYTGKQNKNYKKFIRLNTSDL